MSAASLATEKAQIEADFLKRLTDRIQTLLNIANAHQSDEDLRKEGKIPLHVSEDDLRKMVDRMDELYRDLRLKSAEVVCK